MTAVCDWGKHEQQARIQKAQNLRGGNTPKNSWPRIFSGSLGHTATAELCKLGFLVAPKYEDIDMALIWCTKLSDAVSALFDTKSHNKRTCSVNPRQLCNVRTVDSEQDGSSGVSNLVASTTHVLSTVRRGDVGHRQATSVVNDWRQRWQRRTVTSWPRYRHWRTTNNISALITLTTTTIEWWNFPE